MPSVREVYEAELTARGYASDPAQLRGVARIAALGERGLVDLADGHAVEGLRS